MATTTKRMRFQGEIGDPMPHSHVTTVPGQVVAATARIAKKSPDGLAIRIQPTFTPNSSFVVVDGIFNGGHRWKYDVGVDVEIVFAEFFA